MIYMLMYLCLPFTSNDAGNKWNQPKEAELVTTQGVKSK